MSSTVTVPADLVARLIEASRAAPECPSYDELEALMTRDYLANARRSLRRVVYAFQHLRRRLPEPFPLDHSFEATSAYIEARMGRDKAAAATVANELRLLRRALRLAALTGRIPTVPRINEPRVDNARRIFICPAEVVAICRHMAMPAADVVRFLYLTGWRKSEAFGLRWEHVDREAKVITLEAARSKNGRSRTFPFATYPQLADLIEERLWVRRGPFVFHHDGRRYTDIWGQFKQACREVGLPGRTIHDLRRSAVRNLERAGVPRSVAMQLTGHRTETVYRRYDIVSERDLAAGVARLAEHHERVGE